MNHLLSVSSILTVWLSTTCGTVNHGTEKFRLRFEEVISKIHEVLNWKGICKDEGIYLRKESGWTLVKTGQPKILGKRRGVNGRVTGLVRIVSPTEEVGDLRPKGVPEGGRSKNKMYDPLKLEAYRSLLKMYGY